MSLQLTMFNPESNWKPPTEFPDLSDCKVVAIDLETKDEKLRSEGPGNIRGDGYPVGIAIAADNGYSAYYPIRHFGGGNVDSSTVVSYFTELLRRKDLRVCGANIGYDLGWLNTLGIEVMGTLSDIMVAECLLDEEGSYSLNALSDKYLGYRKQETLLDEAIESYGLSGKDQMWKLPSKYVGYYAEMDAKNTLDIFNKQMPLIKDQKLGNLFELECKVTRLCHLMRLKGVRVDKEKGRKLSDEWSKEEDKIRNEINSKYECRIDEWSGDALARICDREGIKYGRTPKGNPTFDKNFLKHSSNPFLKSVSKLRELNRLKKTYLDDLIFGKSFRGRIHCEFLQTRSEEGGTRSGRFASKRPNLQQVPSRSSIAPKIRSLFVPEFGEKWAKLDYSQQEPRVMVHYAYLMHYEGAEAVRQAYLQDNTTDFYDTVAKTCGLPRDTCKAISLGRCYGMGQAKLANDIGVSVDKADDILGKFDSVNPFISMLASRASAQADSKGYITTILGRRCRFDYYEPVGFDHGDSTPERLEDALDKWPDTHLKRAYTYKALNRLIQGSSADMTKAAMVQIYEETGKIPLLQVHDELDYSVESEPEALEMKRIMENCVDTEVPMLADLDLGEHWK